MSHIQIILASHVHIYQYNNRQREVYNCNAVVYFKQQCICSKLIPDFAKLAIPVSYKNIRIKGENEIAYNSEVGS